MEATTPNMLGKTVGLTPGLKQFRLEPLQLTNSQGVWVGTFVLLGGGLST